MILPRVVSRLSPMALAALLAAGCSRDPVAAERVAVVAGHVGVNLDDDSDRSAAGVVTFENFALGAVGGQQDWQATAGLPASPAVSRCADYDHAIADPTGLLTPARSALLGRRSLRMSNAVTSGCY
ncbi:MAG: hypothetical protein ACYC7F_14125, partial [Gemmatimonadaceae bacterium]